MFAVIKTGGKQYRVSAGQKLRVERLKDEIGAKITLDEVLMHGDGDAVSVGRPLVSGASVKAEVVGHGRGEKIRIFKLRRRKHSKRQHGHRQNYTEIEIKEISTK